MMCHSSGSYQMIESKQSTPCTHYTWQTSPNNLVCLPNVTRPLLFVKFCFPSIRLTTPMTPTPTLPPHRDPSDPRSSTRFGSTTTAMARSPSIGTAMATRVWALIPSSLHSPWAPPGTLRRSVHSKGVVVPKSAAEGGACADARGCAGRCAERSLSFLSFFLR